MTRRKFQVSADVKFDSGLYLIRLPSPPSRPSNTGSTYSVFAGLRRCYLVRCIASRCKRSMQQQHPTATLCSKLRVRTCTTGTACRVPGLWSLRCPVIQAFRPLSCRRSGRTCIFYAGMLAQPKRAGIACHILQTHLNIAQAVRPQHAEVLATDLPHAAALLVAVLVEGEHALLTDQVHGLLGVWECVLDFDAVVLLNSVEHAVCLRVQPPSVQAARMPSIM